MPNYFVVRTDRKHPRFFTKELSEGRLRQGWGYRDDLDLRILAARVAAGEKLAPDERAAWRNRRLLHTQRDGMKDGDIVIVPNLPHQGVWALGRVNGPYRFAIPSAEENVGRDYGHIVPVSPVRDPAGELAVVEAGNQYVHARLRASMRSLSRMWTIDWLGPQVERLLAAIASGADTKSTQTHDEKLVALAAGVEARLWEEVNRHYRGAEFEALVKSVLERGGRFTSVTAHGGPNERGADLMATGIDATGVEQRTAVQVKKFDGVMGETKALDQIARAHAERGADSGMVITSAVSCTPAFLAYRAEMETRLGIEIEIVCRPELTSMLHKMLSGG